MFNYFDFLSFFKVDSGDKEDLPTPQEGTTTGDRPAQEDPQDEEETIEIWNLCDAIVPEGISSPLYGVRTSNSVESAKNPPPSYCCTSGSVIDDD